MKEEFRQIWELAWPYQDKRDDAGHAEVTLHYAELLVELEHGHEHIVVPAMILHDVGWSRVAREEWQIVFNADAKQETKTVVQLKHQTASVEIARGILETVDYPKEHIAEILEIISQHDTREGFISRNEGLVRDADKLWRTSKAGFEAGIARTKIPREQAIKRIEDGLKKATNQNTLHSDAAKRIQAENIALLKDLCRLPETANDTRRDNDAVR